MKRFLFPMLCVLVLLFAANIFAWEAEVAAVSLNQGLVTDNDTIYPNDDVSVDCTADGWGGGSGTASGNAVYTGIASFSASFYVTGNDEDIDWDGGSDYNVSSAYLSASAYASGYRAEAWSVVYVSWY